MALRFSEEPFHRLSPREAQEFLRVHAEREAKATAADAPTVEDLAETLGITPEEARSILQEARARTAPPKTKPRTASQQEARVATIILACALVVAGSFFIVAPRPRSVSAPSTLPAENLSPVAPARITGLVSPHPAPRLEFTPPVLSSASLPLGFHIRIDSPILRIDTGAPTLTEDIDYRRFGPSEAYGVQRRLVGTCLDLIRSAPSGTLRGAGELSLSIMLEGKWTKLVVPLGSDAQSEETKAALTRTIAAAWPQIVR